ncbi:MAG: hypothetical protein EHM81_12735, partial [Chloroflexi bacterium]
PTVEDVEKRREMELLTKLMKGLEHGHTKHEHIIVNQLVAEGHDPLELAAVAIKLLRGEEKQRPITAISEVREKREERPFRDARGDLHGARSPRPERGEFQRSGRRGDMRPERVSHEQGMVRLTLNRGKIHGISPREVVSTIAYFAEIPGHTNGKIFIQDKHTFVDVQEQHVAQVLSKAEKYRINKQAVTVERA